MTDGAVLERLWERQGKRLTLASRWWVLAGGRPGMHAADVGCGTGRIALAYAEWAGPEGSVLAVDPDASALAFLEGRRDPARHANVRTLALDAEESPLPAQRYDAVFVTDVLHHVARPVELLRHLRPTRATLVVAEFDPVAPGEIGPPLENRIAPGDLTAWLADAGWSPEEPVTHPAHEQYAIVCPAMPVGQRKPDERLAQIRRHAQNAGP